MLLHHFSLSLCAVCDIELFHLVTKAKQVPQIVILYTALLLLLPAFLPVKGRRREKKEKFEKYFIEEREIEIVASQYSSHDKVSEELGSKRKPKHMK